MYSYGAADGLGNGRVTHLRFGPNGGLWASTEGGLSRSELDDPAPYPNGDRLRSIGSAQLFHDVLDVHFDCFF